MKVKTILCKSALTKSGIGGVDYVINPYVGCAHACVYCYADFMRRFTGHEGDMWGTFVDIKANIVERLRRELLGRTGRGTQPLCNPSQQRPSPQPLLSRQPVSQPPLSQQPLWQALSGLSSHSDLAEWHTTATHVPARQKPPVDLQIIDPQNATAHSMNEPYLTVCPPAAGHPATRNVTAHCTRYRYAGKIMFSSVTDPYQPLEAEWKLTRGCLEVLLEAESIEMTGFRNPEDDIRIERPGEPGTRTAEGRKSKDGGKMEWSREIRTKPMTGGKNTKMGSPRRTISILTKSDLVTRDIDILKNFQDCTVGLTITTTCDDVSRLFEPGAPPPSRRLAALKKLNESGIKTWVFMGPILPFFSDSLEEMDRLFKAVAAVGTREILMDSMNFYPSVKHRVNRLFARISQNGKHRGAAAYPNAGAHLNKIMHDLEGWRIDIKTSAYEAANKWGIHIELAF